MTEEAGGPWISSAGSSPPQSPVLARSHIASPTSPRRNQGRREARPGDPSFGQREKSSLCRSVLSTLRPRESGKLRGPCSSVHGVWDSWDATPLRPTSEAVQVTRCAGYLVSRDSSTCSSQTSRCGPVGVPQSPVLTPDPQGTHTWISDFPLQTDMCPQSHVLTPDSRGTQSWISDFPLQTRSVLPNSCADP